MTHLFQSTDNAEEELDGFEARQRSYETRMSFLIE